MKTIDRALDSPQFGTFAVLLSVAGYAAAWMTLALTQEYGWALAQAIVALFVFQLALPPAKS